MAQIVQNIQNEVRLHCIHCDEPVIHAIYGNNDCDVFCCHGCKTVYEILHEKGLNDYYEIKQQAGSYKRRSPVSIKPTKFLYLDEKEFLKEFSYQNSNGMWTMEFYLEGIHCLACLWLVERLPSFHPHVISSKLDLEKSVATVTIDKGGTFSSIAQEFNQLGYRPHPLKRDQKTHELKIKEDRESILKIGIAAAGMSNIMLYAVSIYAGAQDSYAEVFNALTVAFGLPVLTYSASPFYKSAWSAIKNKTLSIDIPISIALIAGLVMGVVNLIMGVNENYFDSLTMLVFLLLLSRYFLKKIQERALGAKDLHYFYQGDSAHKIINTNKIEEIHPNYISTGDLLKVYAGEFIPADAEVIEGVSTLNTSLLTGESLPTKVKAKDIVYAGTQNLSQDLIIKALKVKSETRLGEILKGVESGWALKAPIVELTDKISHIFIASVFVLSAVLFGYVFINASLKQAIEQTLTLLIVTCPCALALATPLAFTQALSKAADKGIIIKNDSVIQRISNLSTLFFDKTGTITYGKLSISSFEIHKQPKLSLWNIIYSLEAKSKHPVAIALMEYAKDHGGEELEVSSYQEQLGVGVRAQINSHQYEINQNGIFEDSKKIATFGFSDIIRNDSKESLHEIESQAFKVKLLSGDTKENVKAIAQTIGLKEEQIYWQLSPEQKSIIVKDTKDSMMIGDGANDAIALSHADVGVAVFGAMDLSLRAADVFLATPGISSISKLITISKETMSLIKRNLVISLIYNAISVSAAFMGLISPLTAAIIMPISSLTVLLSTMIGTSRLRQVWKS